jgi:hypothetical protein
VYRGVLEEAIRRMLLLPGIGGKAPYQAITTVELFGTEKLFLWLFFHSFL